jgi:hypothetical protein
MIRDVNVKDVKRAAQQVIDTTTYFTVWGVLALVPFVIMSLRYSDLPRDVVRYISSRIQTQMKEENKEVERITNINRRVK